MLSLGFRSQLCGTFWVFLLLFGPLVFSAGSSLCFSNGDRDVGVRDFGLSFCLRVGYGSWEIFAVGTKYFPAFCLLGYSTHVEEDVVYMIHSNVLIKEHISHTIHL